MIDSRWSSPPAFPAGRDGLVSTIDDYLAFGQMMTTDQLTPEQKATAGPILGDNRGWGFGVSIVTRREDLAAVPGRFGWEGGYGTSWYSDPREDMVGILMTQRLLYPAPSGIDLDFWTSAYQSIDD